MFEHLSDGRALAERALRRLVSTRRPAAGSVRILMIDDLVPDPLFGAGYPRAFAIVRSLVKAGHQVSFYPMEAAASDIARMTGAFGGTVRFWPSQGVPGLRRLLTARGGMFDIVFVSRPVPMRSVIETRWKPGRTRVIYDAEAVVSPREAQRRALFGPAWGNEEYAAALHAEIGLARGADAVTAVSMQDAALIRDVLDVPVFVLAHPVDPRAAWALWKGRKDLLFVGRLTGTSATNANVDSITWFVTQVMPILDGMIGTDWKLHLAGMVDAPELDALASPRVVLCGMVEDLDPLYSQCRLFVAPTRFAAGIPLKVVEAMGHGIPCVATPVLADQLGVDATALPTGASAQVFAERCRVLYTDPVAWHAVRDAAVMHVEQAYSQAAFDSALIDVLHHVGLRQRKGTNG